MKIYHNEPECLTKVLSSLPPLPCSFFQSSLTQTSCCRTWIHQTFPAIAMMTFYRSSKTTEAVQTHINFSDCLQFPWEFRVVAQYLINTKMHSLSLLPLVQFSFASADWLKEVKTQRHGGMWGSSPTILHLWLYLWTVQLYSVDFFTPHTGVCVHISNVL